MLYDDLSTVYDDYLHTWDDVASIYTKEVVATLPVYTGE
jgi:hypothetical protein